MLSCCCWSGRGWLAGAGAGAGTVVVGGKGPVRRKVYSGIEVVGAAALAAGVEG